MYGRFQQNRAKANAARPDAPEAPSAIKPPVPYQEHLLALQAQRQEYEAKLAGAPMGDEAAAARIAELEAQCQELTDHCAVLEAELQAANELLKSSGESDDEASTGEETSPEGAPDTAADHSNESTDATTDASKKKNQKKPK